jgi:hypothetical protein
MDQIAMMKRLQEEFGDGRGLLAYQLLRLSLSGQTCDVTFFKSKPMFDVKIDQNISLALMYGAGAGKLQEMLNNISLSNGETVRFGDVWMVLPMPSQGLSPKELAAVNLADGDEKCGEQGETIREIIRAVYHCESKEEEEKLLRRYLAS